MGITVQFFSKYGNGDNGYDHISLWSYNRMNGTAFQHFSINDYFCDTWARLAHAAAAFSIVGISFIFIAFALSLLTPTMPHLRVPTGLVSLVASLALVITVGITIALYQRQYCNNHYLVLAQDGFNLASGFGLTVAAFSLCFIGGILRIAMP